MQVFYWPGKSVFVPRRFFGWRYLAPLGLMGIAFLGGAAGLLLRLQRRKGKAKPTYEDTMFAIVLSALALFGQAIAGKSTFRVAGLDADPTAPKRFREWLAALLAAHMDS